MKRLLFALSILLLQNALHAQKQANIWYFGDHAGLDFNSGKPVALNNSMLQTVEGCASISDANGNLQFYTRGDIIMNKKHQFMDGGDSLDGCESSTQAALVVPSLTSPTNYFVFTTDCAEDSGKLGLAYTIVDMSQNGGLGKATTRNISLHKPITEKLTAIRHSNGHDVWVITHELYSNAFLAYLVTASGVSSTPVISQIGPIYNMTNGIVGQLKVSPDGNKIASVRANADSCLELFHFDKSTGILSSRLAFRYPATYHTYYGVEFSPDCRMLYCTASFVSAGILQQAIVQYNLSGSWTFQSINQSMRLVKARQGSMYGGLQLGPDKKIYCAVPSSYYLAAIRSPNNDSCDFTDTAVFIGVQLPGTIFRIKSLIGLPGFIQDQFYTKAVTWVETREEAPAIQAYPNPFSKETTITLNNYSGGVSTLLVYNAVGSIVYQKAFNSRTVNFSRNNLPSGLYILQWVAGNNSVYRQKLIVTD